MSIITVQEFVPVPGITATLLPIMGVVFVAFLVIGVAVPVLPLHVHDGLGFGTFMVGLVAGSQFSRPWAGHFSDARRLVAACEPEDPGRIRPMRTLAATLLSFCLFAGAAAGQTPNEGATTMSKLEDVRAVAPALEGYAQKFVVDDLWRRPGLSRRDRSIVTLAALVARDQTVELPRYLALALDSGVKPAEISEIITHLAFYTGWANAMDAIPATREIFKSRNIGGDQLPPASGPRLPLDEAAEKQRATRVGEQFGQITPSLVQYTTDVLFRDLWLRPALAPRDRSLVTVSALIATGQVAQITYHLNRAMDNGLTREEAGEVLGHLAFYAGWPNAFSAAPVVKDVIEKRQS